MGTSVVCHVLSSTLAPCSPLQLAAFAARTANCASMSCVIDTTRQVAASRGGICRVTCRIRGLGHREEATMYPLPPAANPLDCRFRLPLAAADLLRRETLSRIVPVVRQGAEGAGIAIPVAPSGADVELRNKKLKRQPK